MTTLKDLNLDPLQGKRLTRDEYHRDFGEQEREIHGVDSWKFERRQSFEEPGDPSWRAFRSGEWNEALRLLEEERTEWSRIAEEDRDRAGVFHRVRVVEEPLTPYMQWELHAFRVQAQSGMAIRVVGPHEVGALEATGRLPEVVVLGGRVLYDVVYTAAGVPDGAVRFTDPVLIDCWGRFTRNLYMVGEDVISYVERHVAKLPPPKLSNEEADDA